MVNVEDTPHRCAYEDYFKIILVIHNWSADPIRIKNIAKVSENLTYTSDNNAECMSIGELQKPIEA